MGGCYSRHAQFGDKNSQLRRYSEIDTDIAAVDESTMPVGNPNADARASPYKKTSQAGFGFKKPYGGRYGGVGSSKNGNEEDDVKYEPLGNEDPGGGSTGSLNKSKPKASGGSKFGFMSGLTKRSKTEGNMAGSRESLTANGGQQPQQQRGRPPSRGSSLKAPSAYKPKSDTDNWKMIDDCSSVYSGRSNDKILEQNGGTVCNSVKEAVSSEDVTNANIIVKTATKLMAQQLVKAPIASMETLSGGSNDPTPVDHKSFVSSVSVGTSSNGSGGSGAKKPPSKLKKGPFTRKQQTSTNGSMNGSNGSMNSSGKSDKWVRASPAEGDSALSSKQTANANKTKSKASPPKNNDSTANAASSGPTSFLKRGLLRKQKPVNESPKSSQGPKKAPSKEKVSNSVTTASHKTSDAKTKNKHSTDKVCSTSNASDSPGKFVEEVVSAETVSKTSAIPPGKTPDEVVRTETVACAIPERSRIQLASIDAIEVASTGSLCSDDLMLECDINLDEYDTDLNHSLNKSGRSGIIRPRSRSRSGSRSRSRDSLDGKCTGIAASMAPGCRKPPLCRYNTDSSFGYGSLGQRRLGSHSQDGEADEEPLQELASLMDRGVQRRPGSGAGRVQRATRPNSFPGPCTVGTKTRSASLDEAGAATTPTERPMMRPPRHASSSLTDDDVVTINGYMYRQLQQDLTLFKTMVLKLKRVIQEDEFGQAWKNGYKFTSSQPSSPMYGSKDDTQRFGFSHETVPETEAMLPHSHSLMQENTELQQQVQTLQQQLEEQDKVVKLLQQQMTKYECGYSDAGGREFNHNSTQTDSKLGGAHRRVGQGRGPGGGRNSPRGAQKVPRTLKPPSSSTSSIQGNVRQRQDVSLNYKQTSETAVEDDVFTELACGQSDSEPDLDEVLSDPELAGLAGSFGTSLESPIGAPSLLKELAQIMSKTGSPLPTTRAMVRSIVSGDFEEQFELEIESSELQDDCKSENSVANSDGQLSKTEGPCNFDQNCNNVQTHSDNVDPHQDLSEKVIKPNDLSEDCGSSIRHDHHKPELANDKKRVDASELDMYKNTESSDGSVHIGLNIKTCEAASALSHQTASAPINIKSGLPPPKCGNVSNLQTDAVKPQASKSIMGSQLPKPKSRLPTFGVQKVQKSKLPSFNSLSNGR